MNSSINSLQMARTLGSSFFMASGVNGGSSNCFAGGRQVAAEKALGVNHRAFRPQFFPDRKRIFGPARVGVVEIVDPIGDRRMFGHYARGIGHRGNFLRLGLFTSERAEFAISYSSVTVIAISGQLDCASQALSSSPAGTEPSPTSCALPNSSRLNSSGASDLQRAWP